MGNKRYYYKWNWLYHPMINKKNIYFYLSCVVIMCILVFNITLYYKYHIEAGHTLRDAKNVQLAMRMLSIEYLGKGVPVYNYGSLHGMDVITETEIKHLSGADGEITLISWNSDENIPNKFYYQTDKFLVIYEYDMVQKELQWEIYRIRPIMRLG